MEGVVVVLRVADLFKLTKFPRRVWNMAGRRGGWREGAMREQGRKEGGMRERGEEGGRGEGERGVEGGRKLHALQAQEIYLLTFSQSCISLGRSEREKRERDLGHVMRVHIHVNVRATQSTEPELKEGAQISALTDSSLSPSAPKRRFLVTRGIATLATLPACCS